MPPADRWLLPEGVAEILPPAAQRLERLRRELLDLYRGWGYELVIPPLLEFLDSLLTGAGHELDLQTFKLIDQLSGRLLGARADITPQVARIDARRSTDGRPARFCYLGAALRARGDSFGGSRSPLQVGVELYGHAGHESDLEVIALMLATLATAGVEQVHLDLGHVGIFRSLARQAGLDADQENALFDALQRKALPEIHEQLQNEALTGPAPMLLRALAEMNGDMAALEAAAARLRGAAPAVQQALRDLRRLAAAVRRHAPAVPLTFDLAELRGYHYHTGIVFAAYTPAYGREIARGGRYDGAGRAFGQDRAATGFSADLHTLLQLGPAPAAESPAAIYAPPMAADPALEARVNALRRQGERVIRTLPGADPGPRALGCDRVLRLRNGEWVIASVD